MIVGSHQIGLNKRRAGDGVARSIRIGDGCWIGANVTIIDGVEISDGCVIAAGSLVNSNIPSNVLVAGIPAIIKRKLN
jgi:maltose O-acetyltransferase